MVASGKPTHRGPGQLSYPRNLNANVYHLRLIRHGFRARVYSAAKLHKKSAAPSGGSALIDQALLPRWRHSIGLFFRIHLANCFSRIDKPVTGGLVEPAVEFRGKRIVHVDRGVDQRLADIRGTHAV